MNYYVNSEIGRSGLKDGSLAYPFSVDGRRAGDTDATVDEMLGRMKERRAVLTLLRQFQMRSRRSDSRRLSLNHPKYGATGSKMTDIIGDDIEKIIAAKRPDTAFLFFTDGLTLKQRKSDLRKIVEYQNAGDITRTYTYAMADQFEADLRQLKEEFGL